MSRTPSIIPLGYVMKMSELCIIELPYNRFWEEMFTFTFNPWIFPYKDVFFIPNLLIEPIPNQRESLDSGFPYD